MDFEALKFRVKAAAGIAVIGVAFYTWQMRSMQRNIQAEIEASMESGMTPPADPYPRITQVRKTEQSGQLFEALALCRKIVAEPKDEGELKEARRTLGWLLQSALRAAAAAGDLNSGEAVWKELLGLKDDDLRRSAAHSLHSWARTEIQGGRLDSSRRLVGMVLSEPLRRDDISSIQLVREWSAVLLKRRKELIEAGKELEGAELFIEAATLSPWERELSSALAKEPVEKLMAAGRRLAAAGVHGAALAHFEATWESPKISPADREAVPGLRDDCWLGLAKEAEGAGRVDRVLMNSALSFYERVQGPRAGEALNRLGALLESEGKKAAAEKKFPAADGYLDQAQQKALEAWRKRAFGRPPDLWTGVEPEATERIRRDFKNPVEQSNALVQAFNGEKGSDHPLLEVRRLAALRQALALDWAVADLNLDAESALRRMRPLLRGAVDPAAKARVDAGVRGALRIAVAKKNFPALVELGAFQVSELGAPISGDPFRGELVAALDAAAKEYAAQSPNKSLFILTLLADGFPEDPAGAAAKEAALAKSAEAFKAAEGSPPGGLDAGPSGLAGLSVVSVENLTEHHILIFYGGAERFFLRVNPYRRASAVLRDGEYELGVMTSGDGVVPYRSKLKYSARRLLHRYLIERRVNGRLEGGPGGAAPASGDWRLLRVPPGVSNLKIDPASGKVSS